MRTSFSHQSEAQPPKTCLTGRGEVAPIPHLGISDSNRDVQRKGIYREFPGPVAGISVNWAAEILAGEEFSFLSRRFESYMVLPATV